MKKVGLLLIGLIAIINISGQNYFPIVQENNEWSLLTVIESGPYPWDTTYWTVRFKLSGDTILSNQTYKKIYKSAEEFPVNWSYWGGLREENQEVWGIGTNNYPERLIYDFNLNIGDTIWLYEYDPMIVDSIVFKPINNENRKHLYFSYPGYESLTELWIEGIGSNRGLSTSGSATFDGGGYWLLCMKENGELIYMNPNYNNCFLITEIEEINNSIFKVYPNPANEILYFCQSYATTNFNIELRNLRGQLIKKDINIQSPHYVLNVADLKAGVYFYLIKQQNEILQQGKLIVK